MQLSNLSAGRRHLLQPDSRFRAYLSVLVLGSGARVFGLVSQFVVLIILGRLLPKADFGDLMMAFGFYRLAATALGVAVSLVLLYHVSRHPDEKAAEVRLHRSSAILSAILSSLVALAGFSSAHMMAAFLGKPGLAVWLQQLAPFVIFNTLLITSTGALEGRARISESIAVSEVIPNLVRIVLLPAIAWLGLANVYVAQALTLSVLVPWLWAARRLWDPSVHGLRHWTRWDYSYGGKFVATTLFANQLGAIDLVVAGVLFSSTAVADYAIAARIAALYSFFQLAMLKRFAPRAATLIETRDFAALRHETDACRLLMIACGALTIGAGLCVAPFLLPVFGNYASAGAFLVWLAIPTYIQSFYETSDRLLIIAGQPNVPLTVTACSFLVLAVMPFFTAPLIGLAAVPVAMIISPLLLNPIISARVKDLFAITTIQRSDVILLLTGVGALATSAIANVALVTAATCALLGAIGLYSSTCALKTMRANSTASAG